MLVDLSHHSAVMQEVISRCLWVRQYEADVEEVVTAHVEKGGTDGPVLREFVFRYANMRFIYPGGYVRMEVEVTTDVTAALHFYRAWVVEAERRVDVGLWPIGEAFDTAEAVLLGEDGVVYLFGDAGMQRVTRGFPESMLALVTGEWDKTFF
ncbi:hypothetical protein [Nonomuraea dietziae]|uniref:Uncharacterized protein n=1 Tax=Nonomuraea dietziae TaxID=65515 RepID=A0A7W5VE83_9ACTN|nr:hypothetical protein [Nonomuraea dietziae]MBB3733256.1 hypothetical protein [Nonomuraea dietziae]